MKAESRPTVPSPAARTGTEDSERSSGATVERFARKLREDKSLRWMVLGLIILAITVPTALAITNHLEEQKAGEAWDLYARTIGALTSSGDVEKDAGAAVAQFEAIRARLQGTSAEPWLLFELGNRYFLAGNSDKAEEIFKDIKARYPSHRLVDPRKTMDPSPPVESALNDCAVERKWHLDHPEPLRSESKLKAASSPGHSEASVGASDPDQPKSSPPLSTPASPEK